MEKQHFRNTVVSNMFWRFIERCGAQGVTFIVSIILARLLDPSVYGTIALVTVFNSVLNIFIDSGLGNALIQKKDADDLDFSSVFYFNVISCILLYVILFLCAPYIARYYDNPQLTLIIRVTGITLIVSGVKNIQQAYISKNLLFKKFFYATLGGTVGAAFIGIWMAWRGYGVWSLVVQGLFNAIVDTIILWITVKWHPKKMFSFSRLKTLFLYGWKLLVSAIIDNLYNNLRSLIIGKVYTSSDLAFYNKGQSFPSMIIANINASIDSVLLPTMSSVQDKKEHVKSMVRRSIKTSTYIMAPLMMGLAGCGYSLIRLILTEKWLPCVPFLYVFCAVYMFYPIHTANLNAIKALGRSDLFLKLEIIKKVVGVSIIVVSSSISVMAMCYGALISSIASQIINSWPNKKLLHYSYIDQLRDIFPSIALALVMAGTVYSVKFLQLSDILTLLIQIPLGILIYVGGSIIFRIDSFEYVLSIVKGFLRKRKK